jgi:hypothetical protein
MGERLCWWDKKKGGAPMSDALTDAARQTERALKAYQKKLLEELSTDSILSELKRRYKSEPAIQDYVEMIECEVMALEKEAHR